MFVKVHQESESIFVQEGAESIGCLIQFRNHLSEPWITAEIQNYNSRKREYTVETVFGSQQDDKQIYVLNHDEIKLKSKSALFRVVEEATLYEMCVFFH